jgi:hypothetical protein
MVMESNIAEASLTFFVEIGVRSTVNLEPSFTLIPDVSSLSFKVLLIDESHAASAIWGVDLTLSALNHTSSTIWEEDLIVHTVWHSAVVVIRSSDSILWALSAKTVISQELIMTCALNRLTSKFIRVGDHSWLTCLALSINSQDFVWLALYLNAVETSALHVWWALSAQS